MRNLPPKYCRVKEVKGYCTLYGEKALIKMIQSGTINGGRLPESENKTRPWFVDTESLFRHIEGHMPDLKNKVANFLRTEL